MSSPGSAQKDAPLLGRNNLPLRLFTSSGFPMTDVDGFVLRSVAGDRLAHINPTVGIYRDLQGRDLTDAFNRSPKHPLFDPTQQPAEGGNEVEKMCCTVLYDFKGRPLTDTKGRPLLNRDGNLLVVFGPRGEPVSDYEGKQIVDRLGSVIQSNVVRLTSNTKPMYAFDEQGRPLTDALGFALLDLCGILTIQIDANHVPTKTVTGGLLYDAQGSSSSEADFDLTREPPKKAASGECIVINSEIHLIFNTSGHPLTDLKGSPLFYSSGLPMLYKDGDRWLDSEGKGVVLVKKRIYDGYSLKGFKNSHGDPILLFNRQGWPLTDTNGTMQNHANGKVLMTLDSNMDPISDWLGCDLCDSWGFALGHPKFRPCDRIKVSLGGDPTRGKFVQYFNKCGFPLTNRFGVPLLNPQQKPMIHFDNYGRPTSDINGDPVYDILGLPVLVDTNSEITGPNGLPVRLYNNEGRPITSRKGCILKSISGKPFISVGTNGRLQSECKNGKMFDRNLNSTETTAFNATVVVEERCDKLIRMDSKPLSLYDEVGYPMTDPDGIILYDNRGKSLVKCAPSDVIAASDGKRVFDVNGYPCVRNITEFHGDHTKSVAIYDKYGRPLTDQYGNVLRNRKGQKLIRRKYGEPIDSVYGGGLFDINNVILDDPEAEPSLSLARESNLIGGGAQLFDCDDLPVTDKSGDMLYSSSGIALLEMDPSGRPKSDFRGRPVFDERGLPVTKSSGCWKDQRGRPLRLFNYQGFPLTDYDGRPLKDIDDEELIQVDDNGRPLFDREYRFVKDFKGRNMLHEKFKPTMYSKKPTRILEPHGDSARLYNRKGYPLTSERGHPLQNAKGKLLLNTKKGLAKMKDIFNKTVFDGFGRPLGCDPLKPLITLNSKPLVLCHGKGYQLTSNEGIVLYRNGRCSIEFDSFGRPSCSWDGSSLYDDKGRELFKPPQSPSNM